MYVNEFMPAQNQAEKLARSWYRAYFSLRQLVIIEYTLVPITYKSLALGSLTVVVIDSIKRWHHSRIGTNGLPKDHHGSQLTRTVMPLGHYD